MNQVFAYLSALLFSTSAVMAMDPPPGDMARVELLHGWQMSKDSRMMGLRIELADGWHTYWRAPGDAGIPPQLDINSSDNIADLRLHWPSPEVYEQNGMRYVGYEGTVVLPLEVRMQHAGDIEIDGQLQIGVCKDICIPMHVDLSAQIKPADTGARSAEIKKALADRASPLRSATCKASPIADGMRLQVTVDTPPLGDNVHAVLELPNKEIWVSEAQLSRTGQTLTIESDFVPPSAAPFGIDRSEVIISVFGSGKAYEVRGCKGA